MRALDGTIKTMSNRIKYFIIAIVVLSLLIVLGAFLFRSFQTTGIRSEISDAPLVSEVFEGKVKEVSEKFLLVEIPEGSQKTLQIPLDQNVKFKPNQSPESKETGAQYLKVGQRLNIRKTEVGQLVRYDITIYPK